MAATGVSQAMFVNYLDIIYTENPHGSGRYSVTVGALPKYIDFREFEEARSSALQAQAEAKSARRVAIASIAISAVLAGTQAYSQVFGDSRLEAKQLQHLSNAASAIPAAIARDQLPKLDTLALKLDEANRALTDISKAQAELVKQGSRIGRPGG